MSSRRFSLESGIRRATSKAISPVRVNNASMKNGRISIAIVNVLIQDFAPWVRFAAMGNARAPRPPFALMRSTASSSAFERELNGRPRLKWYT